MEQINTNHTHHSIRNLQQISREFLQHQQRRKRIYSREKLQHQKIYSKSAKNFYSENSRERESTAEKTTASENLQQNQQRISTAKTAKKENLQQKKTTAKEKSTAKSTIFTSNGEQRKAIYSIISDKLHKALTKDYIKRVTFQEEFKNHFQQDPGH